MERRVGRGHQTVKSLPGSNQFRRGQKGEWGKKKKKGSGRTQNNLTTFKDVFIPSLPFRVAAEFLPLEIGVGKN